MKRIILTLMLGAFCALPLTAQAASSTPTEQRAAIQKMEDETLARLYKANPDTQNEVKNAVGYAVFSSGSLAVIWISGGYGHGVAHFNPTGKETYMQMATAGVGLGIGAKDYNTVFVFHDTKAFEDFTTTGLDLSAHADAAAKTETKGDAVSGATDVLPGVNIYQLTDKGLMAQVMIQGSKYWRDDSLNMSSTGMNTIKPSNDRANQPKAFN
jgi:lipid-binding SYLF domain-containing protein